MTSTYRWATILAIALCTTQGGSVRANTAGAATVAMAATAAGPRPLAAALPGAWAFTRPAPALQPADRAGAVDQRQHGHAL